MSFSTDALHGLLAAARQAAAIGGQIVRRAHEARSRRTGDGEVDRKSNHADLVTATDRASQQAVFACLRERFPNHLFIGEEDDESVPLSDNPTWIVDPIDGTTNFVHALSDVAVCVAFACGRKVMLGVVHNSVANVTYHAVRGFGAFRNDIRINTSSCEQLSEALVCTEFGSQRHQSSVRRMTDAVFAIMTHAGCGIRGLRLLGSGALDLCYVADGSLDVVYAGVSGEGWKLWDYAAASVIAEEAGAIFCTVEGALFEPHTANSVVCCATAALRDAILPCLT
mmetsp:Transcript_4585/g.12408  ORF Transcript_4585/g.12408 Transcript_4585/m.12408 type:complete len:282 (+) Transcript_4585:94-939(+)